MATASPPRHARPSNAVCRVSRSSLRTVVVAPTTSAYVSPPLILAAATVSLVALRALLRRSQPQTTPSRPLVSLRDAIFNVLCVSRRRLQTLSHNLPSPFRPPSSTTHQRTNDQDDEHHDDLDLLSRRLDRLRDRAVAQLESQRLVPVASNAVESGPNSSSSSAPTAPDTVLTPAAFAELPPLQRREILASAFAAVEEDGMGMEDAASSTSAASTTPGSARRTSTSTSSSSSAAAGTMSAVGAGRKWSSTSTTKGGPFWNAVERLNGRAAALGFMVCLAREVVEPGHPSLFEQVVDVVVPIAQSTPPFLVAVCDRLADLLT